MVFIHAKMHVNARSVGYGYMQKHFVETHMCVYMYMNTVFAYVYIYIYIWICWHDICVNYEYIKGTFQLLHKHQPTYIHTYNYIYIYIYRLDIYSYINIQTWGFQSFMGTLNLGNFSWQAMAFGDGCNKMERQLHCHVKLLEYG